MTTSRSGWIDASGRQGPAPDAPQDGAGVPDAFERLWTPHRLAYIKGEGKPDSAGRARGLPVLHRVRRFKTRTA